jgi:polyribonucleotide nucleotidyltransferase
MFPRLVGTKGATVQRLRDETGTDITIGREDPIITIIGSESALEHAKDEVNPTSTYHCNTAPSLTFDPQITKMTAPRPSGGSGRGRGRGRGRRDDSE